MRPLLVIAMFCVFTTVPARGQELVPPPGATKYYGSKLDEPFNDKSVFTKPPPGPKPPEVNWLSLPPPPRIWSGGFEVGLNGSQSDTNVFNLRLGAQVDRKTPTNLFHSDFLYALSQENEMTKQNQALLNARDEFLIQKSPWSLFSALQLEYDEFRTYDFRFGLYGGVSYLWLDDDTTLFKTRFGAGAMYETSSKRNGPPARWVPEAVLGFDLNHRFTDRQAIVSSVDLYPSLQDIGQYRFRGRVAYEILINPEYGMVLRLGLQERYDSNPGSGPKNSLNYFATLLFKF